MADRVGKIFQPASSAVLRDQFLRDVRLAAIDTGITTDPPVEPGSDWYLLGTALGELCLIGLANVSIAEDDTSVLTATGAALDRKREELGLPIVSKSAAFGKLIVNVTGPVTIPAGQQFTLPNGLRGKVSATVINPADEDEIDVETIDLGEAGNTPGGTEVLFVSPPTNLLERATVSSNEPLTGGTDEEDDERKRRRVLNALRNRPAGGNWAHLREVALNSIGVVQDTFVYPALGGPSSVLIVPVKKFDRDNRDFSRGLNSGGLSVVRGAIHAAFPSEVDLYVKAPTDEAVDVALLMELPDSTLSGGNGQGWLDPSPWPPLVAADSGRVSVTSALSNISIRVTANTTTTPVDAQTRIAWWSSAEQRFYVGLVVSTTGSAGAWDLTLDKPLIDATGAGPQAGDFISPAAANIDDYGTTWLDLLETLGPAEATTDANRTPRANRHPFTNRESRANLTASLFARFASKHEEVGTATQSYASSTSPAIPLSVDTPPSIFVPRHFAIYEA